ncbi:LacI family DNA-binding transcriptional regulator [Mesorhizobium sp.]|uniref:LacI family DNA-binding transcriptional regulator n=1 Tax=Mesorhizobium sp. TaxID=1871066 RepID=UPI000FE77561|nr:LacI family DNA-binding transcriptional regulator [Mesorhizobium sp.]RWK43402.1 MAG: LacI family transcriptional regulator [Mesorhizobium sp.]RWK69926.1 MAG: LacI family transcriptional regulator [Mesorhizobium sp.]RWK77165.1 MAG: LacI family transcriptional regulator [Mesorhizobium sp.]RWK80151.1 MAG: LacI family transcriptional regulator [Mesorhizobium sp.]RWL01453.1 MAG: LacI family transcriptional regulator [Mesorhizobium sp.]
MNHSKTPTLADVGRVAGVSRGTVSNVFNHPHLVRSDVRERVEAAAHQLGYDGPDPRGRVLRDGKFNAVGFLPPGAYAISDVVRSPYGRELVLGVSLACDEAGATLSLVSGTDNTRTTAIREALVDGFILGHSVDIDLITSAQRRRLPFVILESDAGPDVNSIRIDGRKGALLAVRHLTNLGHRHFAILSVRRTSGPPIVHMPGKAKRRLAGGFPLDHERLDGFAQGLAEINLSIDDVPIIETTPGEPAAGAVVFDQVPEATAILTMSDWQAITVLDEALRRGINIPEDVSVVGFDGTAEAARTTPPLTTVAQDIVGKGRLAAAMVFANGPPQQIVMPVELVVRGTTARPRS